MLFVFGLNLVHKAAAAGLGIDGIALPSMVVACGLLLLAVSLLGLIATCTQRQV